MSRHDYLESRRIAAHDPTFAALIMAAYRKADTTNAMLLNRGFPNICNEMQARYDAPGGLIDGDPPCDIDHRVWWDGHRLREGPHGPLPEAPLPEQESTT